MHITCTQLTNFSQLLDFSIAGFEACLLLMPFVNIAGLNASGGWARAAYTVRLQQFALQHSQHECRAAAEAEVRI